MSVGVLVLLKKINKIKIKSNKSFEHLQEEFLLCYFNVVLFLRYFPSHRSQRTKTNI